MTKTCFSTLDTAVLLAGTALLTALTGSRAEGSSQIVVHAELPVVQVQTSVAIVDDYDYFPAYEMYYSRNRHEYVYLEGNRWVRHSEPRGVTAGVLLASPFVRMDFHDSPEQHHGAVVQSYPRNWAPPGKGHDDKNEHRDERKSDDKKDDRRDEGKNDRKGDDKRN